MVVIIKKKRTTMRPGFMQPTDSVSSMRSSTTERSLSSSSMNKKSAANSTHARKSPTVSFAHDYACPDTIHPASCEPITDEELDASFYNSRDLEKFDKDRALTVLMYRTRKDNGVPWDDDLYSLRGLEEFLTEQKKTRNDRRKEIVQAVLNEQERLKSDEGQQELAEASDANNKTTDELLRELLRGVSCSHSKADKHRALALAMKDNKPGSSHRQGSARKLMKKLKNKVYAWASTSNRSMGSIEQCENNINEDNNGAVHHYPKDSVGTSNKCIHDDSDRRSDHRDTKKDDGHRNGSS